MAHLRVGDFCTFHKETVIEMVSLQVYGVAAAGSSHCGVGKKDLPCALQRMQTGQRQRYCFLK